MAARDGHNWHSDAKFQNFQNSGADPGAPTTTDDDDEKNPGAQASLAGLKESVRTLEQKVAGLKESAGKPSTSRDIAVGAGGAVKPAARVEPRRVQP